MDPLCRADGRLAFPRGGCLDEVAPTERTGVIAEAAEALGLRVSASALAEASANAGPGGEGLVSLGRALGLRVVALEVSAELAVRSASPGAPLVIADARGFALLEGGSGPVGRVRRPGAPASLRPLTDVTAFYAVEPALAYSHGDHGHHTSPWGRLVALARTERSDLFGLVVHAVAVAVLALATPVAVQTLVNQVAFGVFLQPVIVLSGLLFGALVFVGLVELSRQWTVEVLQRRVFVRLVGELAYRLPRMSLEARDRTWPPELVNRFFDVLTVQKSLSTLLVDGLSVVVSVGIGTALLSVYHPWLFAYAILLLVGLGAAVLLLGRRGPKTAIDESYAKYDVAGWIEELAREGPSLRSAGGPALALSRADHLSRAYLGAREDHFRVLWRQIAALLFLQAAASTVLLGVGGWLVIARELTLGQLVAAELVVGLIVGGFAKAGKLVETAYDLLAALDKLGHLIEIPLERTGGEALPPGGPARIRVVDLGYDRGDQTVFDGLSFDVAEGERVALVGAMGAGKRTLLELLAGARTPTRGRIEIDDRDLRGLDLDSVRERVGLVLGSGVFDATISENVRMGRSGVGSGEVRAALGAVGILEGALRLPDGLATRLLPTGQPLSDGHARRIGLARAIAGRPRLLLVDERVLATDAEARARVRSVLLDRARATTVLLVTNDPDLARACDRVVTLGGN